jgi:hypothetical protein
VTVSIGFYFPTQAAPTAQWLPGKPPHFPVRSSTDYPEQLTGETAGGTLVVQDKGVQRERFELKFERITQSDRDSALLFFSTVKKSFSAFEYQDAEGTLHTVRWLNAFEFQQTVPGRYSGTILLRKE